VRLLPSSTVLFFRECVLFLVLCAICIFVMGDLKELLTSIRFCFRLWKTVSEMQESKTGFIVTIQ